MADVTISVVMPAYNASAHIADAVQSVLKQSYSDLEMLIVDDGSTDDTADCISLIEDSRVRVIRQSNQGQSAAINHGVANSTGRFIKLIDADDWIDPGHLGSQLKAIGHADNLLASCQWGYFVEDFSKPGVRNELTNRDYENPLEWLIDSLTHDEGMMGGWMWLIPRALWDKVGGYDARLSLNNDFHFSIKLLLASEAVRFAQGAIYSYRKGVAGALSGSAGQAAMNSAFLTTQLGSQLLLECEDSERIRRICADRFQTWLFQFYPEFPDLVAKTEQRIKELGGSDRQLQGGLLLKLLKPLLGWKGVRQVQHFVYQHGWQSVLAVKNSRRLNRHK